MIPHICPSFRPHGTATLPLDGFSRNLIFDTFSFFRKNLSSEIRFQSNLTRIAGTLYEDLCTCMRTPRWMLLKVSHTKVEEKNQNTHFMFGNSFFENRAVNEIMWQKYWRAGQAKWQYNTAHAHYMKDNKCYKHTIRICNNYYYC